MGRIGTQHAGQTLRLRTVAAFLLVLLLGFVVAPFAQAQAAKTPDCCMAADGKGCSMHLHRSAQAQQAGHTFAALSQRCPCAAVAPVAVASYDSLSPAASRLFFAPSIEDAVFSQARRVAGVQAVGSGGTRGPPAAALSA